MVADVLNDDNRPSTRHHSEMTKNGLPVVLEGASETAVSDVDYLWLVEESFLRKIFGS